MRKSGYEKGATSRESVAYRGYLIKWSLFYTWIEKGGQHIAYCKDIADGKKQIDFLLD